jgi:hypothetical protein
VRCDGRLTPSTCSDIVKLSGIFTGLDIHENAVRRTSGHFETARSSPGRFCLGYARYFVALDR